VKELGHEVVVVEPGRPKAIGAARIEHGKLNAGILAELCQTRLHLDPAGRPIAGTYRASRTGIWRLMTLPTAPWPVLTAPEQITDKRGRVPASPN